LLGIIGVFDSLLIWGIFPVWSFLRIDFIRRSEVLLVFFIKFIEWKKRKSVHKDKFKILNQRFFHIFHVKWQYSRILTARKPTKYQITLLIFKEISLTLGSLVKGGGLMSTVEVVEVNSSVCGFWFSLFPRTPLRKESQTRKQNLFFFKLGRAKKKPTSINHSEVNLTKPRQCRNV